MSYKLWNLALFRVSVRFHRNMQTVKCASRAINIESAVQSTVHLFYYNNMRDN